MSTWRHVADWAKRKDALLRLADRLGRSRGRLAVLDRLDPPPAARLRPELGGWADATLAAAWLGHATVLLRIGGMTVLADPVLSSRIGVGFGLFTGGPRRFTAPALAATELPPLDLILLSHAHFDHLDRPTLSRLPRRTPIIAAHHTADLVRDLGFRRVTELRWGEALEVRSADGGVCVTAKPVKHWGARTFLDQHRGYNAYLIESLGTPHRRVLYGGDTAVHEGFRELGRVDLAVLGIGGYDPYVAAHATPEQAWEMANHCRANAMLPMHHSTFRLSLEPTEEPLQRLMEIAKGGEDRIVVREIGGMWVTRK